MLTEDVEITLENLLNIALGTPEIGAVNFNFLHEVISEILKHLGISKKLARLTHEVDYRLLHKRPSDIRKNVSVDSIIEQPEQTRITSPSILGDEIEKELNVSIEGNEQEPIASETSAPKAVASKTATTSRDPEDKGETTTIPSNDSEGKVETRSSRETVVKAQVSSKELKTRQHSNIGPLPPSQRKSSTSQARRSSHVTQRPSLTQSPNRSAERRDSKTPAGDMWHILNINRRVEASEAGIQGLTNLIDTISADLDDLKNRPVSRNDDSAEKPQEHHTSKQDHEVLKKIVAKLKNCESKMNNFESKIDGYASKQLVEDFCTPDQISAMIQEKIDNFQTNMELPVMSQMSEPPTQQSAEAQPANKKSSVKLLKNDYQDVSNKMMFLEQEIKKAKVRMDQLELGLAKKLELAAIEGKAEEAEVQERITAIRDEIESLSSHVTALETTHRTVAEDVQGLMSQTDEFSTQQKSLSSAMRKLERNLEDMTDNFHRTKSDVVKEQQTNNNNIVDENALNKIRGTIFELQEQQTKFQNDIDILSQDLKNKEKKIDLTIADVITLQETKVNKEYVKKEIAGKADRQLIENKVNREQFDICVSELDRNIQDIMQKITGTENTTSTAVSDMQTCLNDKIDRQEMKQIKGYIDNRFKTFKPKVPVMQQTDDVTAAATRKKLVSGCNCISCDRAVDVPTTTAGLALPAYQPLPGMKSIRPVTTFDLQTIRQHMQRSWCHGNKDRFELAQARDKLQNELLQLCGVRDLNELAIQTNRACGGVHTLVEQHHRNPGKPPMFYREEHTPFQPGERQLFETDVLGRDGHIYKGRIQSVQKLARIEKKQRQSIESHIMPHPSIQKKGSMTNDVDISTN